MVTSSASRLTSLTKSESRLQVLMGYENSSFCRIHDLESQGLYSNPIQYYDFIQNRVMILFRPKFDEADHENPDFSLVLSKKHTYDIVSTLLLWHLADVC